MAPPAALVPVPEELELLPLEGMARWLGPTLARWAFKLISMEESPRAAMGERVVANEAYFRRDRHRHPEIDPATWSLRVDGVARPRTFTLADLAELPRSDSVCVMECAGNGNHLMGSAGLVGQARWQGVLFADLLGACGGPGPASHFAFHGLDPLPILRPGGYHYGLALDELLAARALLATHMNGEPLPRARGFPLRLVVPGIYSMSHVKWLGRIEGLTSPHRGIWNRLVFTNQRKVDGRWRREQARWIGLKSLVVRCRRIDGAWELAGWAWGGDQPITAVDVTTDGGKTWAPAELRSPADLFADADLPSAALERSFSCFRCTWSPRPGRYLVASRARAADGAVQPEHEPDDVRGHFDQTRLKWRAVRVPAGRVVEPPSGS